MAISEAYANTITISSTETSLISGNTTLQSLATPSVIQVFIDPTNMAAGDEYTIQIKDKIISAGSQKSIYTAVLDGAQPTPFVTPTLILYNGWDVTMNLTSGSAKSISWSVRKVA